MNFENAKCSLEYRKAVILLSLLFTVLFPVKAQFVDIAIELQSRIELKSMGPQTALKISEGTPAGNLSGQQTVAHGLSWTRIRTIENMVLMVEISYRDPMEALGDRNAAYLNNGSDNILEARFMTGNRASFPINGNTWLMDRMNSPPKTHNAWIGFPDGIVREVQIEYN